MNDRSTLSDDLHRVESQLVDWKRRARDYENNRLTVPQHVADRIAALKKDAILLRNQINGETR